MGSNIPRESLRWTEGTLNRLLIAPRTRNLCECNYYHRGGVKKRISTDLGAWGTRGEIVTYLSNYRTWTMLIMVVESVMQEGLWLWVSRNSFSNSVCRLSISIEVGARTSKKGREGGSKNKLIEGQTNRLARATSRAFWNDDRQESKVRQGNGKIWLGLW